ncbi:MAG: hypothetical protein LBK06_01290 [Planctomycetaceae bacterium]|jgi:hypothetical protein|nr:hypothetical protein [Planctomycetaceae bacterium]
MLKILFILLNGILFVFAFCLTVTNLLVHFSTFLFNKSPYFPEELVLTGVVLIFISLIAMAINTSTNKTINRVNTSNGFIPNGNKLANRIIFLCFIYLIFNFFVWLPYNGSPNIIDNKYVLSDHGRIKAVITEEVYWEHKVLEMRFISGHLIIFTMIPMFYFYFNIVGRKRAE